jgi:hypothetical protein
VPNLNFGVTPFMVLYYNSLKAITLILLTVSIIPLSKEKVKEIKKPLSNNLIDKKMILVYTYIK